MANLSIAGGNPVKRLHLSDKDFSELPRMGLDDTGEMTIRFKVKGANIYDDETLSEESVSYDMEYEILKIKVNQLGLQESTERAMKDDRVRVQTQTQPFPG